MATMPGSTNHRQRDSTMMLVLVSEFEGHLGREMGNGREHPPQLQLVPTCVVRRRGECARAKHSRAGSHHGTRKCYFHLIHTNTISTTLCVNM